ncbi:dihydrodipicolinate synthase family protein [Klebsiella oxytoca]|uniref:dihydrodipicolinate synthase family protein n=1 Tax=Klebsiella oxytoca TaxID=571 RepID=UPI00157BA55A|nr:dihydrodipicolinate synthase family protein [Klebsiella oxytoca]
MQSRYITPAVTVFDSQGRLDPEGNFRLYDFIKNSVSGFVVMGSTGEFFSLDMTTSRQIIHMAAEFPRDGIKAYAGTSRMDIDECVELANYADECGLDGVMIISPWYFRLTDEAIYTFYSRIARRTTAKIFIYNFPERTGYSVSPEVCLRLTREFPNIIGLKDTIPDTGHTAQIIHQVKSERPDFEVYAGYDNNFAHNVLSGGNGCIGGLSNICPEIFRDWMQAFSDNDLSKVSSLQQKVDDLMDIYTVNDPFIPTFKKALQLRGIIQSDHCTAPFNSLTIGQSESIQQILSRAGIAIDA